MLGETALPQHRVPTGRQVAEGVEERPVEIEENSLDALRHGCGKRNSAEIGSDQSRSTLRFRYQTG